MRSPERSASPTHRRDPGPRRRLPGAREGLGTDTALAAVAVAGIAFVALPASASAASIAVEIEAATEVTDPFLVSVTGHYADLHLGYSRRWKEVLVPAGERRSIDVGFVNPLVNMGVSVSVYHPRFVSARARSKETPLALRPVGFQAFKPPAWNDVLTAGGRFDNGGPEHVLGQIVNHVQAFLEPYLATVDRARAGAAPSEATLRGHLRTLDELASFVERSDIRTLRGSRVLQRMQQDAAFARALQTQTLETRALLQDLIFRAGQWLSLTRAQRVSARRLMEAMRYPQGVAEQLMTAEDRQRLGSFLDRHIEDRSARREPEKATGWTNADSGLSYRVRILDTPGKCSYLGITTDLTGVVAAELGGMSKHIKARFCKVAAGQWTYARP